ncbi:MAG TPA: histidine kinase [Rubrobacter sp.]|nr:histidine kinase [Rubrobacter sp.]
MLIVEDSENDALLMMRELGRGYEPDWERVETPEEMKKALANSDWDLILSDHRMPCFGSSEALTIYRQSGSQAPFVVVSGMMGEELAVEAVKAGAHDYVMKDNLARLCATVERGLEEVEERRNRRQVEEELRDSEFKLRALFEAMTDVILVLDGEGRYLEVAPTNPSLLYRPPAETLGKTHHEVFAKEQADAFLGQIKRALQTRRTVTFEYSLWIGGRQVWFDAAISPMQEDKVVWVARDVTERARAHEVLEERVATLSGVAANLTFERPTEDTLDALARSAVNAATAVACGVVLVEGKTDAPHLFGSYGLPEGYTAGLQEAYRAGAQSPSLDAFRTRQPVLVRGFRRFLLADPLYMPIHRFLRQVPWDIVYSVPLVSRDRALGAIFFSYLPEQEPGEDEKVFLGAVADQAAVAVENAHLFAETRGKAVLEERQRLARELHDSVSQALYGIALGAKAAREWLEDDPAEAAEPLDYILTLAEAGITEMRTLIFELRPESLESEGVIAALEKQAAALEARHEIEVEADLCNEPEAPLEIKEALYRIAQESLHNIVKHARASSVEIKMESDSGRVTLEISDDGIGFDANGEFPGHLGLRSMRERVSRLNGRLKMESAPGKGTRICTHIPL